MSKLALLRIATTSLALALAGASCTQGASAQANQNLPLVVAPSKCDWPSPDGKLQANCVYTLSLPHHGYTRTYKLLVPPGYDTTASETALVVDYHGWGNNKANQMNNSCWKDLAAVEKFLVAYPQGTGYPAASFSAGDFCCSSLIFPERDDVEFAKQVVKNVEDLTGLSGNQMRVYASGLSNGGAVSHNLGCEANDVFDGIAPVSQTFAKASGSTCLSSGEWHIPVVDFRALDDALIPYNGGFTLLTFGNWLSAEESLRRWAVEHRCQFDENGPVVEELVHEVGSSYCKRIAGCATDLVQCTVDGPHVPYEAANTYGKGTNICQVAWEVFEQASKVKVQ